MTGTAPHRADLHRGGADSPLPERPLLTTPPRLQPLDVVVIGLRWPFALKTK